MIRLPDSFSTWGTADFRLALKRELETFGPAGLPLQQGLSAISYTLDDPVTVVVMGADDDAGHPRPGGRLLFRCHRRLQLR